MKKQKIANYISQYICKRDNSIDGLQHGSFRQCHTNSYCEHILQRILIQCWTALIRWTRLTSLISIINLCCSVLNQAQTNFLQPKIQSSRSILLTEQISYRTCAQLLAANNNNYFLVFQVSTLLLEEDNQVIVFVIVIALM